MSDARIMRLEGLNLAMKSALLGVQQSLDYQQKQLRKSKDVHSRAAGMAAVNMADKIRDLLKAVDGDDSRGRSIIQNFPTELKWDDPQPDLTKPVPLVVRRAREGETPNFFAGGTSIHATEYWAHRSMRMDSPGYDRYIEAKSLLGLRPVADHAGWVEWCDEFAESVDELLDALVDRVDEMPSYVHACRDEPFEFNVEDWLESYLSDHHHDAASEQIAGLDEFLAAADVFRKRNSSIVTWWSTRDVVIVDQARFDAERAEAPHIVSEWEASEPPYDPEPRPRPPTPEQKAD